MKIIKWLNENLEEKLMAISLWGIVVIMGIQIVMRYVFKSSLAWSEEVSRYLFIYMVFLGMSYGIKNGTHMRIDILEHFIPKLKKILEVIADLSFLVFAVYMVRPGISVVQSLIKTGQTSPAAEIPMYIVYFSLLIGFILVIFRILLKYILKIVNSKSTEGEEK